MNEETIQADTDESGHTRAGTSLKRRNDVVMTILVSTGVAFLVLFFKETLALDPETTRFVMFTAIIVGGLVLAVFLWVLGKWLNPLVKLIDLPPNKAEYIIHRARYLELLKTAIKYPARHIFFSIACWNAAGILVGLICYAAGVLILEEVLVVFNTVFVFSIFTNMMAYGYAKRMVPPIVRELSKLEDEHLELPPGTVGSVRKKIVIFIGAIVLFLLLFFLQMIFVSSLRQSKNVLRQQGQELMTELAQLVSDTDTIDQTWLTGHAPKHIAKGLTQIVIADERGQILSGQASSDQVAFLLRFCAGDWVLDFPLFANEYLFQQAKNNLIISVCCDWHFFSNGMFSHSYWSIFFIVFLSIMALYLSHQIARDISTSLSEMGQSMEEIARGESDLSRRIHNVSSLEIMNLSNWFNRFVGQLAQLIGQIQKLSQKLHQSMNSMRSQSALFVQESQAQKDIINDVAVSSDLLINQSQEVSHLLKDVDILAIESFQSAKLGISSMSNLVDSIQEIKETSELNATVLEYLSNKSEAIQSVMDLVGTIADQTRLLAFNAMIESVSAGEHGYRFSVVAEEVRGLADNVSESTKNIRGIIREILETLNKLVRSYNDEQENISSLAYKISTTSDEFTKIVEFSEKTTNSISKVIQEMDMQRRIIEDSTENIKTMVSSTRTCIDASTLLQQLIVDLNLMVKNQEDSSRKFKV